MSKSSLLHSQGKLWHPKVHKGIIVFILTLTVSLREQKITVSSKHTWHLALLFGICPVYRSSIKLCLPQVCMCMNAMCGVFLPHRIHQIAAGKWLQTRLVYSVHSNNTHLVKIDICEAGIKRNLTSGIKVSFCSAHPRTLEGRGRGEKQEGGREVKD